MELELTELELELIPPDSIWLIPHQILMWN